MNMLMVVALVPRDEQTQVSLPESTLHALTHLEGCLDRQYVVNCAAVLADALCRSNGIEERPLNGTDTS